MVVRIEALETTALAQSVDGASADIGLCESYRGSSDFRSDVAGRQQRTLPARPSIPGHRSLRIVLHNYPYEGLARQPLFLIPQTQEPFAS